MKKQLTKEHEIKSHLEGIKEELPVTFQFTKIQFFEKGIISGNATSGEGYFFSPKHQTPMFRKKDFNKHITRMISLDEFKK